MTTTTHTDHAASLWRIIHHPASETVDIRSAAIDLAWHIDQGRDIPEHWDAASIRTTALDIERRAADVMAEDADANRYRVSFTDLRAGVRHDRRTAEREGFRLVAERAATFERWLDRQNRHAVDTGRRLVVEVVARFEQS